MTTRAELMALVAQSTMAPMVKAMATMAISTATPEQLAAAGQLVEQVTAAHAANDVPGAAGAIRAFAAANGIPPQIAETMIGVIGNAR